MKYKNASKTKVVDKKQLTNPEFLKINLFNLYVNSICVVGLLALLLNVVSEPLMKTLVVALICFASSILILIKQLYAHSAFGKEIKALEFVFTVLCLIAVMLPAIFESDTHKGLGYVGLCIVVLTTDYLFSIDLLLSSK